jgi:hyperosmotically inducible protein
MRAESRAMGLCGKWFSPSAHDRSAMRAQKPAQGREIEMRGTFAAITLALAITGALVAGCSDLSTPPPSADRVRPADTLPTMGQTLDDTTITASVKTKLTLDKVSHVTAINVDTQGGVVTLSGKVDDGATKERAIQVARSVSGVRDVVDNLTVTQ